jgi:pseudouridine-5'-phosphate glycosidase
MSDLVKIYASGDTVAAELMRGRLEAEGIDVLMKGEGEGVYRAGPAYLFVSADDEERARAVVEAVESGAFALEVDEELAPTEAEGD